MKQEVIALVLAGGRGTRLNVISWKRAKPAVPFGGIYRIIDFTLSNLMYSKVRVVGVMTQYKQTSLMEHLGDGASWGWNARGARLKILHPVADEKALEWYEGTADAVYRNLDFVAKYAPDVVLVVSGDHIYRMDYTPMIKQHLDSGAWITVAGMRVPWEETHRFGVMVKDEENKVTKFLEKSPLKISNLASMGIYAFSPKVLLDVLPRLREEGALDFGKDVLPKLVETKKVFVYEFSGYWRDVGTIPSYYETSLEALDPASGLDLLHWRVRTNMEVKGLYLMPPAHVAETATVENTLLSRGTIVKGTVVNSILSPKVVVEEGAVIRDSVLMHSTVVSKGAVVANAVVDKDVVIGEGVQVGKGLIGGKNEAYPQHLFGGTTVIGKGAVIPEGVQIGSNVIVRPNATHSYFNGLQVVEDGAVIGPEEG